MKKRSWLHRLFYPRASTATLEIQLKNLELQVMLAVDRATQLEEEVVELYEREKHLLAALEDAESELKQAKT